MTSLPAILEHLAEPYRLPLTLEQLRDISEPEHRAWIGSSFSPNVYLMTYLGLLTCFAPLFAGLLALSLILLMEIRATLLAARLNRRAKTPLHQG